MVTETVALLLSGTRETWPRGVPWGDSFPGVLPSVPKPWPTP